MAISHSEVDRAVAPPGELARAESAFYQQDAAAAAVSAALGELLAAGPDPRWEHLARTLDLPAPDASLLALALAAQAAPEMRRVYGYLCDEDGPGDASPALAGLLWGWAPDVRSAAGAALLRWRLAAPRDAGPELPGPGSGWVADPLLLAELTGDGLAGEGAGARAGLAGRDVEPAAEPVLYPSVLDEIVGFAGPLLSGAAARRGRLAGIEVELAGPPGSGKTMLAAQASQKLGRRLVSVDAAMLAGRPDPVTAVVREARQARLHDCVLTWQHADQLPDAAVVALDGLADLAFLEAGDDAAAAWPARPAAVRLRCVLPALDRGARLRLWSALAGDPAPAPVTDWELLPAEIATAARVLPAGDTAGPRRAAAVDPGPGPRLPDTAAAALPLGGPGARPACGGAPARDRGAGQPARRGARRVGLRRPHPDGARADGAVRRAERVRQDDGGPGARPVPRP